MSGIVGVRFKPADKVHYFDSGDISLEVNDLVVVETSQGLKLGWVVLTPGQVAFNEEGKPTKSVLRKAKPEDIAQIQKSRKKETEALKVCRKLVDQLKIPMKPISAESNLEGTYITLFFRAEERVDFRELLRKLRRSLKAQVELKQVGARDEAKLSGGIGRCGRLLCCSTFLEDFTPVSIKMAKEQGLSLTPMRISGICGRLLCCLGYENEQYQRMKEKLPKVGQLVFTSFGKGKVINTNLLKETVSVELENGEVAELPVSQLTWQ